MLVINEVSQDKLTGLYNKHYKERYAASRDKETKKKPYAVVAIDLNNFKHINDTHGHGIGDLALRKVADYMKKSFPRNADKVIRTGGDEFTIVLEFDE